LGRPLKKVPQEIRAVAGSFYLRGKFFTIGMIPCAPRPLPLFVISPAFFEVLTLEIGNYACCGTGFVHSLKAELGILRVGGLAVQVRNPNR
jgi:hypothetical protein